MGSLTNVRPGRPEWLNYIRFQTSKLRTWMYRQFKCRYLKYDGFIRLPWSVDLWSPHKHIILGHHVQFGQGSLVHCDADIGNYVLIARNVALVGRDDHCFDLPGTTVWDSPRGDQFKVVIQDDVWVGHGAIILSGVTVGRGAIVSAGAVVIQDIPPYAVVSGNPARLIKWRFMDEDRKAHDVFLDGMTDDRHLEVTE